MGVLPENDFLEGEELDYLGAGFFGFDPNVRSVIYVMDDESSYMYIWVKYKGWYKRLPVQEVRRRRTNAA